MKKSVFLKTINNVEVFMIMVKTRKRLTRVSGICAQICIAFSLLLWGLSCTNPTDSNNNNNNTTSTVTDIDGNVYTTVKIGTQEWTVENLRTTKYNDRTAIPHVTADGAWDTLSTPGYCYYNNETDVGTIKKWGALYNWYAVNTGKLAPAGWHVPTDSEWTVMEKYLVLHGYNYDGTTDTSRGNLIAKSLAAKTDWSTYPTAGSIGCDLTKNNRSGFSALPGGGRSYDGSFSTQSNDGDWWSATEDDASLAWYLYLSYDGDFLYGNHHGKGCGFSVRLVRD